MQGGWTRVRECGEIVAVTFPGLAIRAIFLAFATLVGAGSAVACDAGSPCNVPDGFYFVRAPAGWDGKSRLPVAVFFHGYRSSAADTMANAELGETLSKAGILLVAPDGVGGSWSVADRLSRGRDNIAYTRAVLADVRRRFPIDERRLAARWFETQLQSPEGARARGYLADRGLGPPLQKEFRLGYAPREKFASSRNLTWCYFV